MEALQGWQFWIDVGGTFTDCLARSPDGRVHSCKVLSSGRVKGTVRETPDPRVILDPGLGGFPDAFFCGYRLTLLDSDGRGLGEAEVQSFGAGRGEIRLQKSDPPLHPSPGQHFEVSAGEPAPLLAIRRLLGIGLFEATGEIDVRLGTTRATNALLERQGARTAFLTTEGFGDILRIANQNRPRLFELHIRKPDALYEDVIEVAERLNAAGEVLRPVDRDAVHQALAEAAQRGVESVAICLLHSYKCPEHEEAVAAEARAVGFNHVSISSALSPTIKLVSRADTTVADAYLTPIIRDYVHSIQERIPDGRIKIMTSAGGLVETRALNGKDTLFSGPAGGVVGLSAVARDAGYEQAIGFDMGGTSTDVSRYDGKFVYEFETEKAGIRIVAPMLAIETVAAGGGSVCDFDGQKLVVGPRSAGADPGPACYGGGGPLAVTDVNLFLGRLVPTFFPFDLDTAAVERRLEEVRRRVETGTGTQLEAVELAEGFIHIANASMAAAIKKISVARGYDVRDYVLVSFGGAAGQHACAVARELGVDRVLVHPYAGVLSAYGLGVADVKKFAVRTVLRAYSPQALEALEPIYLEMETSLHRQVLDEGVPDERIQPPLRQLELRYVGQSSALTVTLQPAINAAVEFERLHRQLYGHLFTGRAMEILALRVEVTGAMAKPETETLEEAEVEAKPEPRRIARTVFRGQSLETGVYVRSELRPGDEILGPAMVIEPTSTTVLDPGWQGRMSGRGDLLLTDLGESHASRPVSTEVNPIQLEVFHNQFAAIAEQMGATLQRTSLSVNVKERLDFSCAVFTAAGDLVANAPHMPVHLGAMSETVKQVLGDNPELLPGDVVATNDPLRGGSHLPDVTVVTPVFDPPGRRLLFFTASRAHHAELGGIRPGSMPPDSKNLAEEGVLIRNLKLLRRGEPHFDELRRLLEAPPYPSRAVEENLADVSAQIAANQTGAANLLAMVERYGLETTVAYMGHIQRAAEAKMRSSLARLADGDYEREDFMDEGSRIRVKVEIRRETARFDFTGTSPPVNGNLNANRAIVKAAVLYCLRCLIDEDIPLNDGVLAPVEIVVPRSFLNPPFEDDPRRAVAVVGGNVETSQRVTDVLLGALGLAAASQGTMNNFTFGDSSFGYYETICGGSGAGPDFDGTDAVHTHMTNTRLTDPEVLEAQYPVRLRRFELRRGSGGKGLHRGGDGARREIEFLTTLEVSILSQRRTTRPFGLEGGKPGAAGRNHLARRIGDDPPRYAEPREIEGVVSFEAHPGDRLVLETPGGGGYGKAE